MIKITPEQQQHNTEATATLENAGSISNKNVLYWRHTTENCQCDGIAKIEKGFRC